MLKPFSWKNMCAFIANHSNNFGILEEDLFVLLSVTSIDLNEFIEFFFRFEMIFQRRNITKFNRFFMQIKPIVEKIRKITYIHQTEINSIPRKKLCSLSIANKKTQIISK